MKDLNNNLRVVFITCILLILALYTNTSANSKTVIIKIHDEVKISGKTIRLGDVAEIDTNSWEQTRKLGDIIIGTAPIPGKYRYIKRNDIFNKIKNHRVDLAKTEFDSPERVKIFRQFIRISKKEIKEIILSEINKGKIWDTDRVKIKKIQVSHGVVLPKGVLGYQIEKPIKKGELGPVPIQLYFRIDGKIIKKLTAVVYTEVFADVVVVVKPLRRYQTISSDDIVQKRMDLTVLSSNTIKDYKEVVGKRTTRVINPNTVLRSDLIELPPIIRRKDIVHIVSESSRLKIMTLGEAQEKGSRGQRIKVINTRSREKIYARVVDAKTVRIEF